MTDQNFNFYQNTEQIQNHYQQLSKNYDDLWEYSKDFVRFISENICNLLDLKSTDIFVDLGCGSGLFTKEINNQIQFTNPVICSDISSDMLAQLSNDSQYECIATDAISFSYEPRFFDKIIVKEMIHHLNKDEQESLIKNLFERLNVGGKFLLILLPPTIEYPLFEKALRKYEKLQPNYNFLVKLFKKAGFETEIDFVKYPLNISQEKYIKMVKNRYMSLLSSFSDREIQEGINEIKQKHLNQNTLYFNDIVVFITGKKCQ